MENTTRSRGKGKRNRNSVEKRNGVSAFPLQEIPLSILLEIFSKLSIMAVIQCKSVCKAWRNLISDPNFFTNYTKNPTFATLLISQRQAGGAGLAFYLLEISENGGHIRTPISFKFTMNDPKERSDLFLMKDSCNGFICLLHMRGLTETVYVWNPFTAECISLPQQKPDCVQRFVKYKLVFSQNLNNFKVFRFANQYPSSIIHDRVVEVIEIFSVGTDSNWRRLSSPNVGFGSSSVIALRGFFHWIVQDENCVFIFTFELEEEKAGSRISVPSGLVQDWKNVYLTVLNNCLCIGDVSVPSQLTLWKMSEYGVGESWTKLADIMRNFFPSDLGFENLVAVATLPNGGIVFALGKGGFTLVAYIPKEKTCFEIKVAGVTKKSSSVIPYEPVFSSL